MSKSIPGNHKHMTQDNRVTIEKGLDTGTSLRKIAESIGKDPSTVSKEIKKRRTLYAHNTFNEPSNKFTKGSFKVQLTQSTIDANSIYFDENPMPHYALTMGVKQIISAKQIILIATGPKKAEAIKNMVEGPVTAQVPASILQEHDNVQIFLDEDAASLLTK